MKLSTRWHLFIAKHRSALHCVGIAWRYLLLGGPKVDRQLADVLHPNPKPSLCTCYGLHNAGREAYDDHKDGCPWVSARCESCAGVGWCLMCGGDGLQPEDGLSDQRFSK